MGWTDPDDPTTLTVGVAGQGEIVITDQLPPELVAYYTAEGLTTVGTAYIRLDPDNNLYHYEVVGGKTGGLLSSLHAIGFVDITNPATPVVHETHQQVQVFNGSVHQRIAEVLRDDNGGSGDQRLWINHADFVTFDGGLNVGPSTFTVAALITANGGITVPVGVASALNSLSVAAGGAVAVNGGHSLTASGALTVTGTANLNGGANDSGMPFSPTQAGQSPVTILSGQSNGSFSVVYATPFDTDPAVQLQLLSSAGVAVGWEGLVTAHSATGFTARIDTAAALGSNTTFTVAWTATRLTQ